MRALSHSVFVLCLVFYSGLVACGGGGGGTGNRAPLADAGSGQTVLPGATVSLYGYGSSDPDNDTLTYHWTLTPPAGSSAELSDASSDTPTFTADIAGTYSLSLVVSDGNASSPADTVSVIANTPPAADAGPDTIVARGSLYTLDGTASSDADADTLAYSWLLTARPEGSAASLGDPASAAPTFTPDKDGDYVLALAVSDGLAWSSSDQVTVTASVNIGSVIPAPMAVNTFYSDQLTADACSLSTGDSFNLASFSLSEAAFVSAWAGSRSTGTRLELRAYTSEALLDPWFSTWTTWYLGSLNEGLHLAPGDYVVTLGGGMALPFAYSSVVWRFDSAQGVFDTSLDGDGRRVDGVGPAVDALQEIAITPDGRFLAVGICDRSPNANNYDLALVRYLRDGSLDPSFGTGGKVITTLGFPRSEWAGEAAVALQPDGKIVAVTTGPGSGNMDFVAARYLINGAPDPAFGTSGKTTVDIDGGNDRARDVAVQADGKIVVAGEAGSRMALVRLDQAGALDTTFNMTGKLTVAFAGTSSASSVVIRPDGRICASGRAVAGTAWSFVLAGLTTDGVMDTSLNTTGMAATRFGVGEPYPRDMALQDDGKVLVAGHYMKGMNSSSQPDYDVVVMRYLPSGDLDTGFDGDGMVTTAWGGTEFDRATGIAVQPDGRIVVAGWYDHVPGTFYSWDVGLARFLVDGALDNTFHSDGKVTFSWPGDSQVSASEDVAIQPDGGVVVGGFVDTYKIYQGNYYQYMHSFAVGRFE